MLRLAIAFLVTQCLPSNVQAQTFINIYINGQAPIQIELDNIDSISYTLNPPPPLMNVYESGQPVQSFNVWDVDSVTFTINSQGSPPWVTTEVILFPSTTTAFVRGVATSPDSPITEEGICWSTNSNPTIADNSSQTIDNIVSAPNSFRGIAAYLDNGQTYYARAYAVNSGGIGYGNVLSFTTQAGQFTYGNGVTDIDGNEYRSIVIDNREWMIEDLYVTRFSNGDLIPTVTGNNDWTQLTTPASCWYGNNENARRKWLHGRLYNGYTVIDSRNVCPTGWHVPYSEDWEIFNNSGWDGSHLKAKGYWWMGLTSNNTSGFTAVPAGGRDGVYGEFNDAGYFGYWWGAYHEMNPITLDGFQLRATDHNFYGHGASSAYQLKIGSSIRCVKDYAPSITTDSVTAISSTGATVWATLVNSGGGSILQQGFCYSTSPTPTTANNVVSSGINYGSFNGTLQGLTLGTEYYVRPFITNSTGTFYGWEDTLVPCNPPIVTTDDINYVQGTSPTLRGEIVDDGGSAVTERGFCLKCYSSGWDNYHPTIENDYSQVFGSGLGAFTGLLTGLAEEKRCRFRAYAKNAGHVSYGDTKSFMTGYFEAGSGINDIDGNFYETIIVDSVEWMRQNLRTTRYSNGDVIDNLIVPSNWDTTSNGSWCYYENDSQFDSIYGKLYNYYSVADSRGLCPLGSHAPTEAEWSSLIAVVVDYDGVSGTGLKSRGTVLWSSSLDPNDVGTNNSGFTGHPGGARFLANQGGFFGLEDRGYWWSETGVGRSLHYNSQDVGGAPVDSTIGMSVRCVVDNLAQLSTDSVVSIGALGATVWSTIMSEGAGPLIEKGICWSASSLPTIADSTSQSTYSPSVYPVAASNLNLNTTYYVRAYAINQDGVSYGNQLSFTTNSMLIYTAGSGVTDLDGNNYPTVVLDGEEWMAENLRVEQYSNGDPILNIEGDTAWGNAVTGAWSWYNNDSQFNYPYGKLFNWHAASDARNVCPSGWHVPTIGEWELLFDFVETSIGQEPGAFITTDPNYFTGTANTTNEAGFSGLGAGERSTNLSPIPLPNLQFSGINESIRWWSATEFDATSAIHVYPGPLFMQQFPLEKERGMPIRCKRD